MEQDLSNVFIRWKIKLNNNNILDFLYVSKHIFLIFLLIFLEGWQNKLKMFPNAEQTNGATTFYFFDLERASRLPNFDF